MPLDPLHARILRIAADLPEARTAALAGGGAMLAHALVERTTRDVDLFTDRDAAEAVAIATALRAALIEAGFDVRPAPRPPHENRFVAIEPDTAASVQVEVFPDGGRLQPPVHLDVGPVLHPDDLAADKLLAMWGRGEPRDYVDVVALLDAYPAERLMELASAKDRGFEPDTFGDALGAVQRITPARWDGAGIGPERAGHVREVILAWRARLAR